MSNTFGRALEHHHFRPEDLSKLEWGPCHSGYHFAHFPIGPDEIGYVMISAPALRQLTSRGQRLGGIFGTAATGRPRMARRPMPEPEPPSLRQQALEIWGRKGRMISPEESEVISLALESLPEECADEQPMDPGPPFMPKQPLGSITITETREFLRAAAALRELEIRPGYEVKRPAQWIFDAVDRFQLQAGETLARAMTLLEPFRKGP